MNKMGLVSVSFRQLTPEQIFETVRTTPLSCVEWGADVHCKPEDLAAQTLITRLSRQYGIECAAYGSYYRAGVNNANTDFSELISAAVRLNAEIIRVWAFNKGSAEANEDEYRATVADLRKICAAAAEKKLVISLECHNNTFTDDYTSALRLLSDVGEENLTLYWQPNQFKSDEYNLASAQALRDTVTNVHVFHWRGKEKLPLSGETEQWKRYVELLEGARYPHRYLLEFMPNGTPEELAAEAQSLKAILS